MSFFGVPPGQVHFQRPRPLTLEEARRLLGIPPPHDLTCELLVTGLGCTCRRAVAGLEVRLDDALPPGVVEFRDPRTGAVVGRLENIQSERG